MSKPVLFCVPEKLELKPAPIAPKFVLEGNPVARARRLSGSYDTTSSSMIWTCTPGKFQWNYSVDETLYILSGEVYVTDEKGEIHHMTAGDSVFFPAGSRSIWQVTQEITKIAFCRQSMPLLAGYALRAWNKFWNVVTGFSGAVIGADESALEFADEMDEESEMSPVDVRRITTA